MTPVNADQYLQACIIASNELGVDLDDLLGKCGKHDVVMARRVVWYAVQDATHITCQRLSHLSKFDRTTVYQGIIRLAEEMECDPQLMRCVRWVGSKIAKAVTPSAVP
jgi:chromosomal replication initiation ATPase DnaA